MAVAVFGRDENLKAVLVGQRETLPLPVLRRRLIVVDHDQIEFSVKTRDELPRGAIAVQSPQDMSRGNRNVVLDEILRQARFLKKQPIVDFDVFAAEIL